MRLAETGLPRGGSVGYEIFDRTDTLGTTSFVQNVNHVRALEGELSRTIRSIDRIAAARVHLVIPERQLFTRDRQEPVRFDRAPGPRLAGNVAGTRDPPSRRLRRARPQG